MAAPDIGDMEMFAGGVACDYSSEQAEAVAASQEVRP